MCLRIAGTIEFTPDAGGILGFNFVDPTGVNERLHIGIDRGGAYSGSDFVRYEETTLGDAGTGIKEFSLMVGGRSAALVMQGEVVAALRLPRPVEVTLEARTAISLTGLVTGPAPAASADPSGTPAPSSPRRGRTACERPASRRLWNHSSNSSLTRSIPGDDTGLNSAR